MTTAILTRPAPPIPVPSPPASPVPAAPPPAPRGTAATAYQQVLHQALRREFALLAELASWATAEDPRRAAELPRHADLIGRVLLQHHAVELERLWPALLGSLPATEQDAARRHVVAWTSRTAVLDSQLRDLSTAARQWAVALTVPAKDAFVRACGRVAGAVTTSTAAEEEAELLPLLAAHLPAGEWAAVCRATGTTLSGREQMLVLGLLLEDASAIDRARVLAGLSPAVRAAWRAVGRRNFRAAVVRLRGAPPAA